MVGRTAVGILVLTGGAAAAQSEPDGGRGAETAGELSVRSVAHGLAGDWDGQIEVRSAEGALSTSWVGMSARLADDGERLELYYEGFAFGKPIEGAMLLSFAESQEALSIRDHAAGLRANCSRAVAPLDGSSPENSLSMSGSSTLESGDVRAVFSRNEDGSWRIECQSKQSDGQWSSLLLLSVNRLEAEQRSPVSDNFARSSDLLALRTEHVTASVEDEH
jgi:hypothetical protein